MKTRFLFSSAAIVLAISFPCFSGIMSAHHAGAVEAAATTSAPRSTVELNLLAEQKVVHTGEGGEEVVSWTPLSGPIAPGEIIRYTVTGVNNGNHAISNLVVTQPVPAGTHYVLFSATSDATSAHCVYSINHGRTFTARPMMKHTLADGAVKIKPARAESYTHVRWNFEGPVAPASTVKASYQVSVQ